ncbi:hypothetical protein Tco_1573845 [Tanacetum coccineum]
MPNLKPSIPYPSRRNDERRHEKANDQIEKFYKIFQDMSFEISFADALILMPKFASTLKALIRNKEKLSEMARTPLNEHCLAVILNKLPKKLREDSSTMLHAGNPCAHFDPTVKRWHPMIAKNEGFRLRGAFNRLEGLEEFFSPINTRLSSLTGE